MTSPMLLSFVFSSHTCWDTFKQLFAVVKSPVNRYHTTLMFGHCCYYFAFVIFGFISGWVAVYACLQFWEINLGQKLPVSNADTNEEVRAKVQQAIGPHEDLLTIVKRRKLQWYGHVSCSSGLAKTILQCTVKGGRRQGRQRKRWEDIIWEWTGLEIDKSQRALESREKWRKLVAKSFVVPQRPSGLRDWWWWWMLILAIASQNM